VPVYKNSLSTILAKNIIAKKIMNVEIIKPKVLPDLHLLFSKPAPYIYCLPVKAQQEAWELEKTNLS